MKKKSQGIRDEIANLKRERILNAAVELFYDSGFEKTTLDAIADKLGVRKPFVYSYFESKGDLLGRICEHGLAANLQYVADVLASDESPTVKLRNVSKEMILTVIRNQKHNAIFAREQKNLLPKDANKMNKIRREHDRLVHSLLLEGVKSGEFSIDDPMLATLAIGGVATWVQVWYREKGRLSPDAIAEKLTDMVMLIVKARESIVDKSGRDKKLESIR
jgi:AcrR family transcriptional regulator